MSRAGAEGRHWHLTGTSVLWVMSQARGCQSRALPGWGLCAEDLWSCRSWGPRPWALHSSSHSLMDGSRTAAFLITPCSFRPSPHSCLSSAGFCLWYRFLGIIFFAWVSFPLVSEAETLWDQTVGPARDHHPSLGWVPPPSDPHPHRPLPQLQGQGSSSPLSVKGSQILTPGESLSHPRPTCHSLLSGGALENGEKSSRSASFGIMRKGGHRRQSGFDVDIPGTR